MRLVNALRHAMTSKGQTMVGGYTFTERVTMNAESGLPEYHAVIEVPHGEDLEDDDGSTRSTVSSVHSNDEILIDVRPSPSVHPSSPGSSAAGRAIGGVQVGDRDDVAGCRRAQRPLHGAVCAARYATLYYSVSWATVTRARMQTRAAARLSSAPTRTRAAARLSSAPTRTRVVAPT